MLTLSWRPARWLAAFFFFSNWARLLPPPPAHQEYEFKRQEGCGVSWRAWDNLRI
jgi:hypothetical protein